MAMTPYYREKLEQGKEYQDFVSDVLYKIGLPLFSYNSKKYQVEHGENKLGIEIKFDDRYAETGNIWIEIAEKSNPSNAAYVLSGIYRTDNTWLYVIGNRTKIFVFAKTILKLLHKTGRYAERENNLKTSKGFLLNNADADKYAAKVIICE
jgi:hypothetical protein